MGLSLTKEYSGRRLTWQGWLLLAIIVFAVIMAFFLSLYPYLAPNKPPHKGMMAVEGWIHDFALDEAVAMYRQGNYSKIVCTGVPIETGSYIQQYKSYPEMTAARLIKLGIPADQIVTAISEDIRKDRTYASALALREAIIAYNIGERNIHVVTVGPHGRRSRMLFKKALGDNYHIGVTCLEESSYAPDEWFTCSQGVRAVFGELIAYIYALLFFNPPG